MAFDPPTIPNGEVHLFDATGTLVAIYSANVVAPPPSVTFTQTTIPIHAAVGASGADYTVAVGAGTYTTSGTPIDITQSGVRILGAQHDVDPRVAAGLRSPGDATESIINAASTTEAFRIRADNVEINGFELFGATRDLITTDGPSGVGGNSGARLAYNIAHNAGDDNLVLFRHTGGTVEYNRTYGGQDGINVAGNDTNSAVFVSKDNVVRFNEVGAGSGNGGIYVYDSQNTLIANNYVHDYSGDSGIVLGIRRGFGNPQVDGGIIENNIVERSGENGIDIFQSDVIVRNNTVQDNNGWAISIGIDYNNETRNATKPARVTVEDNTFEGNNLVKNVPLATGVGSTPATGPVRIVNGSTDITFDDNVFIGNGNGNTLTGTSGAETLQGDAGNDSIAGGAETDMVVFSGNRADYTVTQGVGTWTIQDNRPGSPDGTDTVSGTELFKFADYTVTEGAQLIDLPPTDIDLSNATVPENSAAGTVVGVISSTDPDAGDTPTYTLDDPSGNFEIINGNEIAVKAGAMLDFEGTNTFNVEVVVTDQAGLSLTEPFVISLTDVVEAPPGNNIVGTGAAERVTLTFASPGLAKTTALADTVQGNGGNDTIQTGAGNDSIDGGAGDDRLDGGTGADVLVGGSGDDLYFVDDAGDVIDESDGAGGDAGGTETVSASVSFTLGDYLEHLLLSESGNIDGIGNDLANRITGNTGNNLIDGGIGADTINGGAGADTILGGANNDRLDGGAGADQLAGGSGDDLYSVDNAGDVVDESDGAGGDAGGTETVSASVSFTLGDYLEHLLLTGSGNIDGIGNDLVNRITGNTGNNLLDGGIGADTLTGGAGDDTLEGGAGSDNLIGNAGLDMFVFSFSGLGTGVDRISDFVVADDTIRIDLGNAAATFGDHITYNAATGALYWDADGIAGAGGSVQIAIMVKNLALTAADFDII